MSTFGEENIKLKEEIGQLKFMLATSLVECKACDSGKVWNGKGIRVKCGICHGTGWVTKKRILDILEKEK